MSRVAIFCQRGEYEALHTACSVAAAAASAGKQVELYVSWWALDRVARGDLDAPRFADDDTEARFEARQFPTIRELLGHARAAGDVRLYACSASAELLGLKPQLTTENFSEILGWHAVLARTATVTERFFF